jgi:hypothetical protein
MIKLLALSLALLLLPVTTSVAQPTQCVTTPSIVLREITLNGPSVGMQMHKHLVGNDARSFRLAVAERMGRSVDQLVMFDEVITTLVANAEGMVVQAGVIVFNEGCYVMHTTIPFREYMILMSQQAVGGNGPNAS